MPPDLSLEGMCVCMLYMQNLPPHKELLYDWNPTCIQLKWLQEHKKVYTVGINIRRLVGQAEAQACSPKRHQQAFLVLCLQWLKGEHWCGSVYVHVCKIIH